MTPKSIEQEVEKTLNSLQDLPHLEPDAFFYTRLKARMENEIIRLPFWMTVPFKRFAFACFGLLLVANSFTILQSLQSGTQEQMSAVHTIEDLSQEYFSTDFSLYQ
ncbi:MAG: hypothetical protein ACFB10_21445 [Salibacteraceae bacterium]